MMDGDMLHDGTVLTASHHVRKPEEKSCVWTNPDRRGALINASKAIYDGGQTVLTVVLQVRIKSGTFTERNTGLGYIYWVTENRGNIVFESVDVKLGRCKSVIRGRKTIVVDLPAIQTSFTCPHQVEAYKFLKEINLPVGLFNKKYDCCYCITCFKESPINYRVVGGELIADPCGFVRFGLLTNPSVAKLNGIFDNWNIAYHGCTVENLLSIIKHRGLFIPGDKLMDGSRLGSVNPLTGDDKKGYFLSPHVGHSGHHYYAKPKQFTSTTGQKMYGQVIIQFKVRPETFQRQQDTDLMEFDDYCVVNNNVIEWYSTKRGCTVPYGIVVRTMTEAQQANLTKYGVLNPK